MELSFPLTVLLSPEVNEYLDTSSGAYTKRMNVEYEVNVPSEPMNMNVVVSNLSLFPDDAVSRFLQSPLRVVEGNNRADLGARRSFRNNFNRDHPGVRSGIRATHKIRHSVLANAKSESADILRGLENFLRRPL